MKLSTLMLINTFVALIFGIAFVLVPGTVLTLYGVTLSAGGLVVARLFGAALIGFGMLTFLAMKAEESEAMGAIVLALFISDVVGFIVALQGQLSGAINTFGWTTVAIYLLLALGFGYFRFIKQGAS